MPLLKLEMQFPRPRIPVKNQIISVVRAIKVAGVRSHQSQYLFSMIEQGSQAKYVVNLIFAASQRHIQETDWTQVRWTTKLHLVPAAVSALNVDILFHTSPILHNRVATIREHCIEPTNVGAIRVIQIVVRNGPVHSLGT